MTTTAATYRCPQCPDVTLIEMPIPTSILMQPPGEKRAIPCPIDPYLCVVCGYLELRLSAGLLETVHETIREVVPESKL